MTTITATPILSSVHAVTGDRLDTLLLRYPRCIHSEFMTHRVFSRNAASSRAIPVEKLIADVERDPFVPLVWTKNEPGMQGREVLDAESERDARRHWNLARVRALDAAWRLSETEAHKQIVNRLLEPFAHITVVVSSSHWKNFLALREHPAAEPHIQLLAKAVREALNDAPRQLLQPGEWHLPFVSEQDIAARREYYRSNGALAYALDQGAIEDDLKILSVARCASTSYKTVDGFDMDLERATAIYDKLVNANPMHASPFEHVAQVDGFSTALTYCHPEQHRNFTGFRQLRAIIEGAQG